MSDVRRAVEDYSLSVPFAADWHPFLSYWTQISTGLQVYRLSHRSRGNDDQLDLIDNQIHRWDTHCFNVHWGFPISRSPTVHHATYPPFTYCSRVHPNTSNTPAMLSSGLIQLYTIRLLRQRSHQKIQHDYCDAVRVSHLTSVLPLYRIFYFLFFFSLFPLSVLNLLR